MVPYPQAYFLQVTFLRCSSAGGSVWFLPRPMGGGSVAWVSELPTTWTPLTFSIFFPANLSGPIFCYPWPSSAHPCTLLPLLSFSSSCSHVLSRAPILGMLVSPLFIHLTLKCFCLREDFSSLSPYLRLSHPKLLLSSYPSSYELFVYKLARLWLSYWTEALGRWYQAFCASFVFTE